MFSPIVLIFVSYLTIESTKKYSPSTDVAWLKNIFKKRRKRALDQELLDIWSSVPAHATSKLINTEEGNWHAKKKNCRRVGIWKNLCVFSCFVGDFRRWLCKKFTTNKLEKSRKNSKKCIRVKNKWKSVTKTEQSFSECGLVFSTHRRSNWKLET